MFRIDEINLIDAKELASSQATKPASQYRQEFLCDFSASSDNVPITIDLVSEACQLARWSSNRQTRSRSAASTRPTWRMLWRSPLRHAGSAQIDLAVSEIEACVGIQSVSGHVSGGCEALRLGCQSAIGMGVRLNPNMRHLLLALVLWPAPRERKSASKRYSN